MPGTYDDGTVEDFLSDIDLDINDDDFDDEDEEMGGLGSRRSRRRSRRRRRRRVEEEPAEEESEEGETGRVQIQNDRDERITMLFIDTATNTLVSRVPVRSGRTYSVDIPTGIYQIYTSIGRSVTKSARARRAINLLVR